MFFDNQNELNIILNNNINDDNTTINPKEGLIKGNMFNNEYKSYKNIQPKDIEATNEKSDLCLKIYELDFAITDLALYLDLHKNDNDTYNIFKNYVKKYKEYKEKYENNYDIICQDSIIKNTYSWTNNPWPKDNDGGIKYV